MVWVQAAKGLPLHFAIFTTREERALHRILCIAGVIGALAIIIGAVDANAFSISPVPNQSPDLTLVAGGCGLGFHRGPYGCCRPNIAG